MATDLIGARPEELETLHTQLSQHAQEVQDLMHHLTSTLDQTTWWGNHSQLFRHDWETSYKPNLQRMSDALTDAHTAVKNQKDAFLEIDGGR
jgi:WXG100 family type VII secretion target